MNGGETKHKGDITDSPAPRVLVIGYGNPLRGDDGVGWVAAQKLAERVDPQQVATMAVHLLTPELADPISKVDLVIFIDAADGTPPGYLSSHLVKPAEVASHSITHHFDPQRLLSLAQQVYGRHPQAYLFTVGGDDFGHREELSQTVEHACDKLVDRVAKVIADSLARAACG